MEKIVENLYGNQYIEKALNGLSALFHMYNNTSFLHKYSVTEKTANCNIECSCFFYIKHSYETCYPIEYLDNYFWHRRFEREFVFKFFILVKCISTVADIWNEKIHKYLDLDIKSRWNIYNYENRHNIRVDLRPFDETNDSRRQIYDLVNQIYDLDFYLSNCCQQEDFKAAVSLTLLTAGYHFYNDNDKSSFLAIAESMYQSIITGEDFYEIYRDHTCVSVDVLLAMVQKNITLQNLALEKSHLELLIQENIEKQRQQETAGEIISSMLDSSVSQEVIRDRINKCNSKQYRDILYRIESIKGKKVSILAPINDSNITLQDLGAVKDEFGVCFSTQEEEKINTVEQFIDTISAHIHFIDMFKDAILNRTDLYSFADDADYDLESKIKELEQIFRLNVDRTKVLSLDALYKYILDVNPILNKLVSIIVDKLDVRPSEVTMEAYFTKDLGADSLDYVELIMDFETAFDITISDEEAEKISKVGDAYNYIISKPYRTK